MPKFRKKPIEIEAKQWLPCQPVDNSKNPEMPYPPIPSQFMRQHRGRWQVKTEEGWLNLAPYDWIIKGIMGEFYPCKPEIFAATYEPVESEAI